nr:HAMP domain-containing sensor histidine kinase [uncultured Cellulosilyticum sp.]
MKRMSIKIKVTLWFTAVMLLIVVASFGTLFSVVDLEVSKDYKKQLREVVESNIGQVEYDDGVLEFDDDFVGYKSGVFIFVYEENGNMLLGQTHDVSTANMPLKDESIYEVERQNITYLVYDLPVYVEDYGEIWIRGMMERHIGTQRSTLDIAIQFALIGFPLLVILAAIAGYILTKHSFKPIEKIIDAAEKISEGKDLSKRIGLDGGSDEIYRLAQSFDNMFKRLEVAFEAEKKFASDASHELRTPTTVILSECEYMLDGDKTIEEYREALEVIERQGYKMSKLITQLLAFTRLEQGTQVINKEKINLSELVIEICEEQAYLSQRGIQLQYNVTPKVYVEADETLISRVIINLISNAYKYGKENGHIIVTLKNEKNEVYFSVQDDGIGIKEEDLSNIWRRFYRADESRNSTHTHSLGLGLAMVKQIADLHDAKVSVRSRWGEGSEFIVVLKKSSS